MSHGFHYTNNTHSIMAAAQKVFGTFELLGMILLDNRSRHANCPVQSARSLGIPADHQAVR